jgi:hypothetical protein
MPEAPRPEAVSEEPIKPTNSSFEPKLISLLHSRKGLDIRPDSNSTPAPRIFVHTRRSPLKKGRDSAFAGRYSHL